MSRERTSRFLALVLRHQPGAAGVTLDAQGWCEVPALLSGLARAGRALTEAELSALVAEDAKGRYALSPDGARIRANQGHSAPGVALDHARSEPPPTLWHGTTAQALPAILREGLRPQARHHVHLSADAATARAVAARRRGPSALLRVEAGAVAAEGLPFWCSANGAWLAEVVPPRFLAVEGEG